MPLALDRGYLTLERTWRAGDTVTLALAMPVRRIRCHPAAADNRGRLAVERGPLVYCAEAADNGGRVLNLTLAPDAAFREGTVDVLGHRLVALTTDARAVSADLRGRRTSRPAAATLIPYFAWCHRGAGEMQVWFPTGDEHAEPASELVFTASHCHETDSLTALHDGRLPKNSGDHDVPRMTWWPRKGTEEWVHVDLKNPEKVTGCSVYWFDDTGRSGCRLPASWTVQIPDGSGGWADVAGIYPVAKDKPCEARFAVPVSARALRLRAVLQPGFSGGVLEWQINVE